LFTEYLQLKLQGWDPETRGNFNGNRTKGRFVACLKLEVFFTEKAGISGKLRKAESGEEATGNYRIETLASRNSEVPANPLSLK